MWINYFKTAFRSLIRNKFFSLINIFGLATGMAGCIVIMLWIQDELNYDTFLQDREKMYRVMSYGTKYMVEGFDGSPAPLSFLGRESIPEIESSTAFRDIGQVLVRYGDNGFYEEGGLVADTCFFDFFSFDIVIGDPRAFFADPFSIVINERLANRYFGDEYPIGKTLIVDNFQVNVTGVFRDVPVNSTLQFDFIVPFTLWQALEYHLPWGQMMYANFVKIPAHANPDTIAKKLTRFAASQKCPQVLDGVVFKLQPMHEVHLDGKHNNWRLFYKSVDKRYITAFSLIAVFILLIACMNYINLTTAKAEKRSREVGLRKVSGANQKNLIHQFLGESLMMTLISLLISLILVELIRPAFNLLTEKQLGINYSDPVFILGIISVFLITGILAGAYPAFVLAAFNPIKVLKGLGRSGKGGAIFRKSLVVIQFMIASALIIGSIVIYKQINFIRHRDLGFDNEQIVYIPLKENLGKKYKFVKNELLLDPNIISVTASDFLWALDANRCSGCFQWEGYTTDSEVDMLIPQVDFDFFETMGIPIIEGRAFSSEYSTDSTVGFMVNESAAKKIAAENVLGKPCKLYGYKTLLHSGPIVGIFKDIHYRSLHHEIDPQVVRILRNPEDYDSRGVMLVKINGSQVNQAISRLETLWNEVNKITPFEFHFLDQTYENLYKQDQRVGTIVRYFTMLAIIISCLGILGLAAFMA
nr:ABC transporter permease [Bacteroidota bacterium]